MFLLILLTLGTFWGFLEAFLFVFLVELKATSYLLGEFYSVENSLMFHLHNKVIFKYIIIFKGMTVTVGALVGIPFLFVSDIVS